MTQRRPPLFRSLRLLQGLNVLGAGCTLASLTGVVLGQVLGFWSFSERAALGTALPTLVLGVLGALLLRRRKTGSWQQRLRWKLSVSLAILDTLIAFFLVFPGHVQPQWSPATFILLLPFLLTVALSGAVIWLPALMLAMLAFGFPVLWSQEQAKKGLAGEERGEVIVGLVLVFLSAMVLLLGANRYPSMDGRPRIFDDDPTAADPPGTPPIAERRRSTRAPDSTATWFLVTLAGLGATCGAVSSGLALGRERRRRRFVADAEAGVIQGYRVDLTAEGKVLVRVTPDTNGYRDFKEEEELFALDLSSRVAHPPGGNQGSRTRS